MRPALDAPQCVRVFRHWLATSLLQVAWQPHCLATRPRTRSVPLWCPRARRLPVCAPMKAWAVPAGTLRSGSYRSRRGLLAAIARIAERWLACGTPWASSCRWHEPNSGQTQLAVRKSGIRRGSQPHRIGPASLEVRLLRAAGVQ